jgi:threonine dehydratase
VTVLMPTVAPLAKVEKCRSFGANVVIHGKNIGEAKQHAETAPEYEGMRYVNGYDDVEIISGAGTMGVEILEQLPDCDVVVIPTGGAGLLAGTALAMKTLKPSVEVLGVEPMACPSFTAALEAGEPVPVKTTSTLADGLAVPTVGGNAFKVAREHTDVVVQVNEGDVALAMLRLVENEKLVVEGGGATGLAGILPGGPLHERVQGKKVVVPLCGGNIDTTTLGRVIERGLAADERLVRFVAQVSDLPGGVANLTKLLADHGASIKDIYHERAWLHTSVAKVQVKCVIETIDKDHAEKVRQALCEKCKSERSKNETSRLRCCWRSCFFFGCVSLIRSRHIERTILSCNEPHANHAKRPHFMAAEPFLGGDGVLIWTLTTHQCSLLLFRESASVFTFNHHGSRPFFLHLHIQWLNVLSLHAYREKHFAKNGRQAPPTTGAHFTAFLFLSLSLSLRFSLISLGSDGASSSSQRLPLP